MSWSSTVKANARLGKSDRSLLNSPGYDFELLLAQIGDRDAVVDACLPPQLAQDLRKRNINAVWVPAILGDGASDEEIERQLLIGEGLLWESRKDKKVLLTRDVKFYRKLRSKAILVKYRCVPASRSITPQELRKELKILRNGNDSHKDFLHFG
jgi:predicted nuclease of predicted toxin-antitoxin system